MSVSAFFGLQTSLRGLLAQQRALDVTGHNITNAGTAGYSRQEAVLSTVPALQLPAGAVLNGQGAHIGAGVDVAAYERIRDTFLDLQYRGQATVLGDRAATTRGLERAELALAEPGENGIAAQLAAFWNAWADVANAPENPAARQALVDQGVNLAAAIKALDEQLARVGAEATTEYNALIAAGGEVDVRAREIARLNKAIVDAYANGATPNDLLDRRDLLLDELSALATVATTTAPNGDVEVVFGGEPLVSYGAWTSLENGTWTVPASYTDPRGRLGALLQIGGAGGTVASYRADLEAFADRLVADVNAAHPGFFSAGAASASTMGVAVTALTLAPGSSGQPGDNSRALAAAALRGSVADDAYASLVTRIGGDLRSARREERNADVLTKAVDNRRQSVAGVSMDEEMANLVRFQRGYQASARALSTMDEILDVLINRTGRVGL